MSEFVSVFGDAANDTRDASEHKSIQLGQDMNEKLHTLFLSNIKLLAYVDRAICCFRMSMYDRAL